MAPDGAGSATTPKSRSGGAERARAGNPAPGMPESRENAISAVLARVWARSVPADDQLARVYLARRFAWPPRGIGPDLPATVRWLAREAAPGSDRAAKWYGLPDGAAGALVFAWRDTNNPDPAPRAVSLVAVSTTGERVPWFGDPARKVYMLGARGGLAFEARSASGGAGDVVNVAEGEADTLALVLSPWCARGAVYAVGGTAGKGIAPALGSDPVVVHADGDGPGRAAALASADAVEAASRECRVEWYRDGDPADELKRWLMERSAIRELDGGATREDADRGAWHDLMRGIGR